MNYSVLMPYLNRAKQFETTVKAYEILYGDRSDIEFLIHIDLTKNDEDDRLELIRILDNFPFRYVLVQTTPEQPVHSPSKWYNKLAKAATGKFFILTSPEVCPIDDILGIHADDLLIGKEIYSIFACADGEAEVSGNAIDFKKKRWYQHTKHRPSDYNFCSIISRHTFDAVGGFSDEFSYGVGYDDNDFRDTLLSYGNALFVRHDDILTIHQKHRKPRYDALRMELTQKNRDIYLTNCEKRGMKCREN